MSRLDSYLVASGLCESRNRAQALIKNRFVSVNDSTVTKSSYSVEEGDRVEIKEHKEYVSRSAWKLLHFLEQSGLDVHGRVALDIGSSTGGFTQVLLERGAKEVSAVDVGSDQLHHSLREDSRVLLYESCDIRLFETPKRFDVVVSDVAFISLLKILDDIDRLALKDIVLLFKPQFEVGREAKRDKNGVVTDTKAIHSAMQRFEDACSLKGWNQVQKSEAKIAGKEGNQEYCYHFVKQ